VSISGRNQLSIAPDARFFAERVFGASRKSYLTAVTADAAASSDLAGRRAEITAAITDLNLRQQNLIDELERLQPSGDPDADEAWRRGIQNRFTAAVAEQRQNKQLLADLTREGQATTPVEVDILDLLPQRDIDVRRLPEDQQRDIYDAFHLELRYNCLRKDLTIRATITAGTAQTMAAAAETISGERHKAQRRGPELVQTPAREFGML